MGVQLYLNETLYAFLDVEGVGLEATGQLSRDFVDEVVVRHMLPVLHNAHDARLQTIRPPGQPLICRRQ